MRNRPIITLLIHIENLYKTCTIMYTIKGTTKKFESTAIFLRNCIILYNPTTIYLIYYEPFKCMVGLLQHPQRRC